MLSLRINSSILTLCRAFSKISVRPQNCTRFSVSNSLAIKTENYVNSSKLWFAPQTFVFNVKLPVIPVNEFWDIPLTNKVVEVPYSTKIIEIYDQKKSLNEIIEPTKDIDTAIHVARLIIIRRKKMKKHKLKKLRKKMKFEWAKVRQRREMRKEKAFQAELIGQIREAEKFSADKYVNDKIAQVTEMPIPRFWKGRRLPQFLIKQKLGIK